MHGLEVVPMDSLLCTCSFSSSRVAIPASASYLSWLPRQLDSQNPSPEWLWARGTSCKGPARRATLPQHSCAQRGITTSMCSHTRRAVFCRSGSHAASDAPPEHDDKDRSTAVSVHT